MSRGFTFEQMAVLILVILGLTVGVILAATQFRSAGSSVGELTESATSGTEAAVSSTAGLICSTLGGDYCATSCTMYILNTGKESSTPPSTDHQSTKVGCTEESPYCCEE